MVWSIDEAAKRMGMPAREVLAVAEVGDVHVVTTHDGQHTIVTDDGRTEPFDGTPPGEAGQPDAGDGEREDAPGVDADGDGTPDDTDGDGVPDGTADQVLTWVGEDAEKAKLALAAEQAKAKPRSTLVAALDKLATPPAPQPAAAPQTPPAPQA